MWTWLKNVFKRPSDRPVRLIPIERPSIGSDRPGFNQLIKPDGTSEYTPNTETLIDCCFDSSPIEIVFNVSRKEVGRE